VLARRFFDHAEMAGLQYIVKSNFAGKVFTLQDIEEAAKFSSQHFSGNPKCFHYEGWKACMQDTVVFAPTCQSCQGRICRRSAERNCYRGKYGSGVLLLTNWAETVLLQIWYPITVATLSRAIKQIMARRWCATGDLSGIAFKLHDFDSRGQQPRIGSDWRSGAPVQFSWHRQI